MSMSSRLRSKSILEILCTPSQRIQQLWTATSSAPETSTSYSTNHSQSVPVPRSLSSQAALAENVVPAALLQELWSLDSKVRKGSRLNGRERQSLSQATLPTSIPEHDIEPGLPSINVHVRPDTGKNFCKWLRLAGRTPARVMSLPGTMNVHMKAQDGEKLVRQFGVHGCQSRVVQLNVVHPDDDSKVLAQIRAKPHLVSIRSNTAMVEAVTFLYCPSDRIVEVDVPIKLMNDDAAPGVKKGGWMYINKRLVQYKCLGSSIPPCIEVDVRHLELDQVIRLRELPIPPGTKLMAKDYNKIVVTCTNDVTETTNLSRWP